LRNTSGSCKPEQVNILRGIGDKVGDIDAERLRDELVRNLAVLDGIVKQRGNNQIRVLALGCFCD